MALVMKNSIAFLGPEGTFAHVAGISRFGKNSNLVPKASIKEVFDFVTSNESHLGIVPIENSSGGTISPTVDCLTEGQYDGLKIRESLSLNVRLALMAKKKDSSQIKVIYSHHAPLHHCQAWLDKHYPRVPREDVPSTGFAVKQALKEKGAAAIGNRNRAGERWSAIRRCQSDRCNRRRGISFDAKRAGIPEQIHNRCRVDTLNCKSHHARDGARQKRQPTSHQNSPNYLKTTEPVEHQ